MSAPTPPPASTSPGPLDVWLRQTATTPDIAAEIESLGYHTLWLGGSPAADLQVAQDLLAATSTVQIATGIVNMWAADPREVADSHRRITDTYGDRFLLGVGIGHRENTAEYRTPYRTMVEYLETLRANGVPAEQTVLAALGPRALRLAKEQTAGSHPYFTTPTHTAAARDILGPDALLVPEQKVLLDSDPDSARAAARKPMAPYLNLVNYRNNLLREGFTEAELDDGGSDRLVDAIVLHGTADAVLAGLRAHLDAGASRVAVQPIGPDPVGILTALAEATRAANTG